MVLQKTTEFLLENFPDKRFELFNDSYVAELYQYLSKYVSLEEVGQRRDEIRESIVEFFKDLGIVSVVFKGFEKIVIRIRPYARIEDNSRILDKIENLLRSEKKSIIESSPRDDLITFSEHLIIRISHEINSFNPDANKKEIIKEATIKAFELTPKDVVVQLKGKIFIRLFNEGVIKNNQEVKKPVDTPTGREKRFNGLPPEELEKIKEGIFPKGVDAHLPLIAELAGEIGIDFTRMTNDFFEKNHIGIMQKALKKYLGKKGDFEDFVLDGLVNYIFRENFEGLHRELAKRLLEAYNKQAGTSEIFIQYYTGDVVVHEGDKYRVPEILDESGNIWKAPTIKALVKQRFLNLEKQQDKAGLIKKSEASLEKLEEAIVYIEEDLEKRKVNLQETQQELDRILVLLMEKRKELQMLREAVSKRPEDNELGKELEDLTEVIKNEAKKEKEFIQVRTKEEKNINIQENKLITTRSQIASYGSKMKEDLEKLEDFKKSVKDIEDKYNILLDALTKALLKKKTKL